MSILTPVTGEGLAYSGNEPLGAAAVRLPADAGDGKAQESTVRMKLPRMIGGAVIVGDYLYGTSGPTLLCVDFKTGQVKWSNRSAAPGPCATPTDGCTCTARMATSRWSRQRRRHITSLAASLRRIRPARANAGEKAWAYPAIANGRLYIRDADCLWCYDIKAAAIGK